MCTTCGEEFQPEPGKPGLISECWSCGEVREGELGIRRARAPIYVPSYQLYGGPSLRPKEKGKQ